MPVTLAQAPRPVGRWSAFFPPAVRILAPFGPGAIETAESVFAAPRPTLRRSEAILRLSDGGDNPEIANQTSYADPVVTTHAARPFQIWAAWLAGVSRVQDAVARLPSIPTGIWLGGIAVIVALRGLACRKFRELLAGTRPAPGGLCEMVRDCAARVGLTSTPEVLLTDQSVSPMVSGLGRRRLIFPAGLWFELDDDGRRAIIIHELAHLRRRDDWVRWAESVLSAIYWWHPGVWWARRRIHEEAENCCDLWVTWLLPRGRTAYAQALLRTRAFIDDNLAVRPSVGIAAVSVRARPLARRITMVMTQTVRPGLSVSGAALILAIAGSGWLVTPAFSCPDDEGGDEHVHAPIAPVAPIPPQFPIAAQPAEPGVAVRPAVAAEPIGPSIARALWATAATVSAGPGHGERDDDDELEDRIERLEHQIHELMHQGGRAPGTPAPMAASLAPLSRLRVLGPVGRVVDEGGPKVWRSYRLSKGKLDALTDFMSRQDVPILVRRQGDTLEIEGTERQQQVFQAFVRMIEPQAGELPPGARGGVNLGMGWKQGIERKVRSEVRQHVAKSRMEREQVQKAMRRELEKAGRDVRRQARDKQRELQALDRARQKLEENAERLREKAERLREQAEKSDRDDARSEALRESEAMLAQAGTAAEQASRMMENFTALEHQAIELDAHAEELEGRVEAAAEADAAAAEADEDAAEAAERAEEAAALGADASHESGDEAEVEATASTGGSSDPFRSLKARVDANPQDGGAWYDYAYQVHMGGKDYREAIRAFQRAAELDHNKVASLYNTACGYARLGDKDAAFEWMKKAEVAGWHDRDHIRQDEDLKSLHDDPRFSKLVDADGDEGDDDEDSDDDTK